MTQLLKWLAIVMLAAASANGQLNPVYVDDSPTARDTLSRASEFAESGNVAEATRSLQRLLDEEPDRLVMTSEDPDLYVSVREAVHDRLLRSPELLEHYRATEGPTARWMLDQGRSADVERSRLLTEAGLEATLREARTLLERGHFEGARRRLRQLDRHPDRAPGTPETARAARLLARVARYLPRQDLHPWVRRWAEDARLDEAQLARIAREDPGRPPLVDQLVVDAVHGSEGSVPRSLSETPLAWGDLVPPSPGSMDPTKVSTAETMVDDLAEGLWTLPTVAGDTLYINDGIWISAWDRYTLDLRWVADLSPAPVPGDVAEVIEDRDRPRVFARRLEDANTLTVHGRVLLAATGLALDGRRDGDGRVHALDARTGRRLWSVELASLDPRLGDGSVRGPIVAEADTAVLAVRRVDRGQRFQSITLVGLDIADGSLKWLTPMGSAGALPYARGGSASDGIILHRGLAVRFDDLGVMAAVEIASGRPAWVRTFASVDLVRSRPQSPWEINVPIAAGELVIGRSPDRREIVALTIDEGRIVASRATDDLEQADYLVKVANRIAVVGPERLALLPLDGFAGAAPAWSPSFRGGIRGRVVPTADALLVPHEAGVSAIDPASPEKTGSELSLDRPGTVLPLDDELIVLDDFRVAAHLSWSVAERVLRERIERFPTNPTPAVMFAEVAFRAGRPSRVPEAADTALEAIARMADRTRAEEARQRLYRALEAMVERMEAAWMNGSGDAKVTSLRDARAIIERLGRVAAEHEERVTHLLALGRLNEVSDDPRAAIDAYQRLLSRRPLAETMLSAPVPRRSAATEVSRRVRALVNEYGTGIYRPYDNEARRAASELGLLVAPSDVESLARRYPAASVTPELWARAAELRAAHSHHEAALANWSLAVNAAASLLHAGAEDVQGRGVEALVGRLVAELKRRGRISAAAHTLARLRSRVPGLSVAVDDRVLPASTVLDGLRASLRDSAGRPPRLGMTLGADPVILPGWAIMDPQDRTSPPPAAEHILLLSRRERRVALFGVAFGESEHAPGHIRELWSIPVEGRLPALVRADPDAFLLYWPDDEGGILERVEAVGGQRRWRTQAFSSYFEPDPAFEQYTRGATEVPGEGRVPLSSQLFVAGDDVVALVQRTGRIVAFDLKSGRVLWKKQTSLRIVADADARAGRLLLVGQAEGRNGNLDTVALVHDIRSGERVTRTADLQRRAAWGLLLDENRAVVGLESLVAGIDLTRTEIDWRLTEPDVGADVFHAWAFDDLLLLIDSDRSLSAVDARTGEVIASPPTAKLRMSNRIEAYRSGDRVALVGPGGVAIIRMDGSLAGEDALPVRGQLLTPVPVQRGYLTLVTTPRTLPSGRPAYMLHALDDRSAKLTGSTMIAGVWDQPHRLAAMTGWIAVDAGSNTLIYRAPFDADQPVAGE